MDELKERLRHVDHLSPPDMWEDARSRTPRAMQLGDGAGAGRRVIVAFVAFAIFAAALVGVWRGFRPAPDGVPSPRVRDSLAILPEGWTELSPPPDYRCCAAIAWTGDDVIVWSGTIGFSDVAEGSGYIFDPISGKSSSIATAPIAPRALPASAWTGHELLVWGGWEPGSSSVFFDDGAAYDPVSDSWRSLPPAPISARAPLSVWTGSEWILWGTGVRRNTRPLDGAAYDPATNSWRNIAPGPIELTDATAAWSGKEMIVFGAALHGGNHRETPTAIAAAYDPSTDTWRELPPSPLDTNSNTAAWNGSELIALDYNHESAAYDPATNEWSRLGRIPGDECEGGLSNAVAVIGDVFASDCGSTFLLRAGSSEWIDVTPEGGQRAIRGVAFVPFGSAQSREAALVFGAGQDFEPIGLLAYRPRMSSGLTNEDGADTAFVPEVTVAGNIAQMPIVFPDGSSAVISYPQSLELGGLGATPHVSYLFLDDRPPRFPIVFLYGGHAARKPYVVGSAPLQTVTSADGGAIEVWRAADVPELAHRDVQSEWLIFQSQGWDVLVSVADRISADDLARSLEVDVAGGFPVVLASGPIALSDESGEGEGPELFLVPGGVGTDADTLLTMSLEACTGANLETSGRYGAACLDGQIQYNVHGPADFVRAVVDGVKLEAFEPS
jgi:hypothetical protein